MSTGQQSCAYKRPPPGSKHSNILTQFNVFRKDRNTGSHNAGGVAIIVQKSVASKHIKLMSDLEVVAARVMMMQRLITVCSIYIPPDYRLNSADFIAMINQLPEP